MEIINNDGLTHNVLVQNSNIFPLPPAPELPGRGVFINAQSGSLNAAIAYNLIVTDNHTIATQDDGAPNSLILDLRGNSTLTTNNSGVPTMRIEGSGTHSTILTTWEYPNQVIGSVNPGGGGGILFDQVTFDADGNPSNGFQQVVFGGGELKIGSVPPESISRVSGDGLSFLNTSGSLSIPILNIGNRGGNGLKIDLSTGSDFDLTVGSGTIDSDEGDFPGVSASTSGDAQLCLDLSGLAITTSETTQDMHLEQMESSTLGITQASLNELSTENSGVSVDASGTIVFGCSIP
ncbi:MAG: hypothetical protein KC964_13665 [Candidatus Omnitrophica bacterium]|nr:hypothetical protein [Candidatus Omnitrophota bacterium]